MGNDRYACQLTDIFRSAKNNRDWHRTHAIYFYSDYGWSFYKGRLNSHLGAKGALTLFTTRIKEFRAQKNLTQEQLANLVGVRRETIVFLEMGKYNPSLKLALDVAKALDATIEELFIFHD